MIGQITVEAYKLAACGVCEADMSGSKALTLQQVAESLLEFGASAAVDRVAEEGMTEGLHVYPYLVCPSRFEDASYEGVAVTHGREAFEHLVVGTGFPSVGGYGHTLAVADVPSDGLVDSTAVFFDIAEYDGSVFALKAVSFYLLRKL